MAHQREEGSCPGNSKDTFYIKLLIKALALILSHTMVNLFLGLAFGFENVDKMEPH